MFFLQKYKKKQKEALFIKKNYIFAKKKEYEILGYYYQLQ